MCCMNFPNRERAGADVIQVPVPFTAGYKVDPLLRMPPIKSLTRPPSLSPQR